MEALKFFVWQLLVEAMASTSVPALIALVGSVLLAQLIGRLIFFEGATSPSDSHQTLSGLDELFTSRLRGGSY